MYASVAWGGWERHNISRAARELLVVQARPGLGLVALTAVCAWP